MIADFKKKYPECSFNEDHLKNRVKSTLKDLNTGTSNKSEGEKASLQSDDFLKKVQESKTFAQRNVLNKRLKLIESKSETLQKQDFKRNTKRDASTSEPVDESKMSESKPSKMALLQQQVQSVKEMGDDF